MWVWVMEKVGKSPPLALLSLFGRRERNRRSKSYGRDAVCLRDVCEYSVVLGHLAVLQVTRWYKCV